MKYKHLTSEQRNYIYLNAKGSTRKSIAEVIGVSKPTVSRELRRNGGKNQTRFRFIFPRRIYFPTQKDVIPL